jgi:hypothetical protein
MQFNHKLDPSNTRPTQPYPQYFIGSLFLFSRRVGLFYLVKKKKVKQIVFESQTFENCL